MLQIRDTCPFLPWVKSQSLSRLWLGGECEEAGKIWINLPIIRPAHPALHSLSWHSGNIFQDLLPNNFCPDHTHMIMTSGGDTGEETSEYSLRHCPGWDQSQGSQHTPADTDDDDDDDNDDDDDGLARGCEGGVKKNVVIKKRRMMMVWYDWILWWL